RGEAPSRPIAPVADAAGRPANHVSISHVGPDPVWPRGHRRRGRLVDLAVSGPHRLTLVLRFADVGVATYASLRVVGPPAKSVTWVVEEPILLAALATLGEALPDPRESEARREAIDRALSLGSFAAPDTELELAYRLGVLLIAAPAWQLLR